VRLSYGPAMVVIKRHALAWGVVASLNAAARVSTWTVLAVDVRLLWRNQQCMCQTADDGPWQPRCSSSYSSSYSSSCRGLFTPVARLAGAHQAGNCCDSCAACLT
jgi:hypothetical protein